MLGPRRGWKGQPLHAAWTLYRERGARSLWERCLGFMDASLEEAITAQHRDLGSQLRRIGTSPLARQLIGGTPPDRYGQFRDTVPLTTYDDYADTIGERRADTLLEPPSAWLRTSGRADGKPKWAPLAPLAHDELSWIVLAFCIASMAREPGDVRLPRDARILNLTAPPPYLSGTGVASLDRIWPVRLNPDPITAEADEPFEEALARAFDTAMADRVDVVLSYASVLAGIGETFRRQQTLQLRTHLRHHPRAGARLLRARLRARLARRPVYPRDLWPVRGAVVGGTDAETFRDRVRDYWGREPLDILGSTEALFFAMQAWDHTTLTLIPSLNFFEFLPADGERVHQPATADHRAALRSLDELDVGRTYELVVTSLLGGPFIRYRTGDILKVHAPSSHSAGATLPQFTYHGRLSDMLEIAGFARLTERTVEAALRTALVGHVDWVMRKELEGGAPIARLLIELDGSRDVPAHEVEARVHDALSALDRDWADMERIAALRPLRVTLLAAGSFTRVGQDRGQADDINPHGRMNPTDAVVESLLYASREIARP